MSNSRSQQEAWLKLFLLILPLGFSFIWGDHLSNAAFAGYNQARELDSFLDVISLSGSTWLAHSPLFLLLLANLTRSAGLLPLVMRLLTGLGWGGTAVAIYALGRELKRPSTGVITGLLVALSPGLLLGLGTAVSWTLAWGWLALFQAVRQPKRPTWLFLAGLLFTWLGFDSLIFVSALILLSIFSQQRWAKLVGWTLLLISILALLILRPENTMPLLAYWGQFGLFLWLILPFLAIGMFTALPIFQKYPVLLAALIWPVIGLFGDGDTAISVMVVLSLFLLGLGIQTPVDWFRQRGDFVQTGPGFRIGLSVLLALPVLAAQLFVWGQNFQQRPVEMTRLEREAGQWLNEQTGPDATLIAEPNVAFWAQRTAVANLATADQLIGLANPADYIVLNRDLVADQISRTNWFQERYESLAEFSSPYVTAAPIRIWGYRPTVYDLGVGLPLNVKALDAVQIVGYQLEPARVLPGERITATLHMKLIEPLTAPVRVTLRLSAQPDDAVVVESEQMMAAANWQPGQVAAQQFALIAPTDLPVGAYMVNFSLGQGDDTWPLYRNNDANVLDRVTLGETAVPWQGDLTSATANQALFGEAIRLAAFEVADEVQPGESLPVHLYWEALGQPQKSYVVFVHLLDEAGNLVSSHDSAPRNGRFPTNTWLPGDLVQDTHTLQLAADLPEGAYQINIGLYLPETGERVPVQTADGTVILTQSLPLTTITVR
jgi:MFS family permease